VIYDHLEKNRAEQGVIIERLDCSWDIVLSRNWTGSQRRSRKISKTLRVLNRSMFKEVLNEATCLRRKNGTANFLDKGYYF
jgi:hypothetical protein